MCKCSGGPAWPPIGYDKPPQHYNRLIFVPQRHQFESRAFGSLVYITHVPIMHQRLRSRPSRQSRQNVKFALTRSPPLLAFKMHEQGLAISIDVQASDHARPYTRGCVTGHRNIGGSQTAKSISETVRTRPLAVARGGLCEK